MPNTAAIICGRIIKAEERAANARSTARSPALRWRCPRSSARRSCSAARRAPASTGPTSPGPRAKIDEELAELDAETDHDRKLDELGDLLFAVVNLARHLNIEPEAALREANRKFEQRFRAIEQAPGFSDLSLDEMEALWAAAKAAQAASSD